jgi:transcriptional regulator
MYNPAQHAEDRTEVLHVFMRQHPLAVLVTCGTTGPEATHVPMMLHPEIGPKGVLRCHVARGNDQWKTVEVSASVLAIFQGVEHYITPSWYAATQEHGRVVPTWNYETVHVRGRAKLIEDEAKLLEHLRSLTDQNEHGFEKPWSIDHPPKGYIESMSKGIVGIEIAVDTIEGKWKVSQNRSEADRQGVVAGLKAINSPASLKMAELVRERSPK